MSRPTPALMAQFRRPVAPPAPVEQTVTLPPTVSVTVDTLAPGKVHRPGRKTILVDAVDDGIRKAKHLKPGMVVRPYLHGEARGSERTVLTVERLEDSVRVSFSSGHPTQDYKPAYRFIDEAAVGRTIKVRESAPTFEVVR